jgi:putative addiction module antidote
MEDSMTTLKLTAIGNSTGVIFPKELLAKLHVEKGDMLYVTESADGITLRSYDENFARQMEIGRRIMREDYELLKQLAE